MYASKYKAAYLTTNPEGRKTIALVEYGGKRTSTAYARYLLACHLGRFLKREEHVDHIDNDKSNDEIGNLQLLSPEENRSKYWIKRQNSLKVIYKPKDQKLVASLPKGNPLKISDETMSAIANLSIRLKEEGYNKETFKMSIELSPETKEASPNR